MKRLLGVTLGILTAVGGFVDAGDLVASSATGARFGMSLSWALVLGLVGILVYADMAGRVAAISGRPVFDLVRERLGAGVGLVNLVGSTLVNVLTLVAEIAGVALAVELLSTVGYVYLIPLAAIAVWLVVWRLEFEKMERIFGLLGLAMVVMAVTVWRLHPDWSALLSESLHPTKPKDEAYPSYFYYGIALFASAMTPYEVFFFSSGAVEERWGSRDLVEEQVNVFAGFPLGALLAMSLMVAATLVLQPAGIDVGAFSQVVVAPAIALGKVGVALTILAIFATTFGAALETALSSGYTVCQYFGWQWGKGEAPRMAARFHIAMLLALVIAVAIGLSGADPIKVTEYSLVFAAVALPLTYYPILLVANDEEYMGDKVNGRVRNALGTVVLLVVLVAAVAALPLMVWTKGGA